MSKEVQRRVFERLEAMADAACDVVEKSLTGKLKIERNSTVTHDAWKTITTVIERPEEAADELLPSDVTVDELKAKRDLLRLKTHGR